MIIPEGYVQITFGFTGSLPFGAYCTLGASEGSTSDPFDYAGEVALAVSTSQIMEQVASSISMTSIHVKFGPNDTGASGEIPVDFDGGDSGDVASPNTTFLLRKFTALGGREGRGRMFWPGPTEAAVGDDGLIATGTLGLLVGQWQDFFDLMAADAKDLVLLHNSATTPTPLTAIAPDLRAATQRRRLRR